MLRPTICPDDPRVTGSTGGGGDPRNMAAFPPDVRPETGPKKELPPQFRRTLVHYPTKEAAGTIIVDTPNTYLYLVLGNRKASASRKFWAGSCSSATAAGCKHDRGHGIGPFSRTLGAMNAWSSTPNARARNVSSDKRLAAPSRLTRARNVAPSSLQSSPPHA
jgi:hypothetical protein